MQSDRDFYYNLGYRCGLKLAIDMVKITLNYSDVPIDLVKTLSKQFEDFLEKELALKS